MKTYTLADTDAEDNQKTINISETKSVTSESRVTINQLQEEHAQQLQEIEATQTRADSIVDQLQGINDDEGINLTVENIPTKFNK